MAEPLALKKCLPCRGGVPPLPEDEVRRLLAEVPGWMLNGKGHLEKSWEFPGFRPGLEFVKRVGEMAEEQGHHPDVSLAWGRVTLEVWTHKIGGLVEADFIFAAKADALWEDA
ncbi:MAG: 4a-hydroxytetrahydrobiopterin dehydratase [Elusimicrobia bacterium]|nr:4a-hydroxytetrahydrobiopterin dehydratase [Elusimicrobiota bacterium]